MSRGSDCARAGDRLLRPHPLGLLSFAEIHLQSGVRHQSHDYNYPNNNQYHSHTGPIKALHLGSARMSRGRLRSSPLGRTARPHVCQRGIPPAPRRNPSPAAPRSSCWTWERPDPSRRRSHCPRAAVHPRTSAEAPRPPPVPIPATEVHNEIGTRTGHQVYTPRNGLCIP